MADCLDGNRMAVTAIPIASGRAGTSGIDIVQIAVPVPAQWRQGCEDHDAVRFPITIQIDFSKQHIHEGEGGINPDHRPSQFTGIGKRRQTAGRSRGPIRHRMVVVPG